MFALLIAINSGLLFQKELCKRMIEMYEVALKLSEHLKLIVFGSLFGNYICPIYFRKLLKLYQNAISFVNCYKKFLKQTLAMVSEKFKTKNYATFVQNI